MSDHVTIIAANKHMTMEIRRAFHAGHRAGYRAGYIAGFRKGGFLDASDPDPVVPEPEEADDPEPEEADDPEPDEADDPEPDEADDPEPEESDDSDLYVADDAEPEVVAPLAEALVAPPVDPVAPLLAEAVVAVPEIVDPEPEESDDSDLDVADDAEPEVVAPLAEALVAPPVDPVAPLLAEAVVAVPEIVEPPVDPVALPERIMLEELCEMEKRGRVTAQVRRTFYPYVEDNGTFLSASAMEGIKRDQAGHGSSKTFEDFVNLFK